MPSPRSPVLHPGQKIVISSGGSIIDLMSFLTQLSFFLSEILFNVSKSTVHKDISERLKILSPTKAQYAKELLETNKSERHIRGGNATKEKYLKFKDSKHS